MWKFYVTFCLMGAVSGVLSGVYTLRSKENFVSRGLTSAGVSFVISILTGIVPPLLGYGMEMTDAINVGLCSACATLLTFSISVILMLVILLKQSGELKMSDVLFDLSKALRTHLEVRKKELDTYLQFNDYKSAHETYLSEKKKIAYERGKLSEQQEVIQSILNNPNIMCYEIPLGAKVPITQSFATALHRYVRGYSNYCQALASHVSAVEKNISKASKKRTLSERRSEYAKLWTALFLGICNDANTILFESNQKIVRTHVRVLSEGIYKKMLSVDGKGTLADPLTEIPCGQGMIYQAFTNHTSLVKSKNSTSHYTAKNDRIWKDYITFVIDGYEENNYPLVAFGISIQELDQHEGLLYFISYMGIEEQVSNAIKQVDELLAPKGYGLREYITERMCAI